MISQLLLCSLKGAFALALLYVPYTFILQKESFFRTNRFVLLAIVVMSMTLPFCNVSWMSLDEMPVVKAAHRQLIEIGIPVQIGFGADASAAVDETSHFITWFDVVAIVFFAGMLLSVIIRCTQLGILSHLLHHNNLWSERKENGIRICCRKGRFSPYSWMRTIVISEDDWKEAGCKEILLHETGHIRAHHSLDMLLLMLCQALQWYNPFVWMLGRSLSDVHEYEADDYVLRQGVEMRGYQMLLIKKAAGSSSYTFANSFNHSLTKKRITMMQNSNHNPWRRSRVLYVLPVAALALSAFATPKFMNPIETAVQNLEDKGTPILQDSKIISQEIKVPVMEVAEKKAVAEDEKVLLECEVRLADNTPSDTVVYENEKCDELPLYGEQEGDYFAYVSQHIKYPAFVQEHGVQGKFVVKFVIEKDGSVSNVKSETISIQNDPAKNDVTVVGYNLNDGLTPEAADSLKMAYDQAWKELLQEGERVVRSMDKWKPGKVKGEPVRTKMALPLTFRLD